jgi:glycosyltransferase involved in cell wall biosynthesis
MIGETLPGEMLLDDISYKRSRVAIVSYPWVSKVPYKFLSELLQILEPITDRIVLIDGNTDRIENTSEKVELRDIATSMHAANDIRPAFYSKLLWLMRCIKAQLRASIELVRIRREVDVVLFYLAYPFYLAPLLTAKLLRKKAVEVVTYSRSAEKKYVNTWIFRLQDRIMFSLLDGISPESKGVLNAVDLKKRGVDLKKHEHKILTEGSRFVDTSRFRVTTKFEDRDLVVGYIGRLDNGKGIKELVEAIPQIAKNKRISFLIGGSGECLAEVKKASERMDAEEAVSLMVPGWIEEEELPILLNALRLFILPTHRGEGLPTIILEAMACGTPVLATPVGAIPDVIINEVTGFLLESTTPECIAQRTTMILNYTELEKVADNAGSLIRLKFTKTAATERYDKMLKEVLVDLQ